MNNSIRISMITAAKISTLGIGVFLITGLALRSQAFEGPPPSLLWLVHQAELIIVADVTGMVEIDDPNVALGKIPVAAKLDVIQVLKGRAGSDKVEVDLGPQMTCPTPARYVVGETVIAFLSKRDRRWYTPYLAHGTKVAPDAQIPAFATRIKELVAIQSAKNEELQRRYFAEWSVRCAEQPVTRSEGINLLAMEAHALLNSSPTDTSKSTSIEHLDSKQLARLHAILQQIRPQDDTIAVTRHLVMILAVASGRPRLVEIARELNDRVIAEKRTAKAAQQHLEDELILVDRFIAAYDQTAVAE